MFGSVGLTRKLGPKASLTIGGSAFSTRERETYDIQGQYWLNETGSDEELGVGTYMEHARNLLNSNTQTLRAMAELRPSSGHRIQAGALMKWEQIKENTREWEFRDSAGYSMPHLGDRLELIYNLKSVQDISSSRWELFVQDTWRHETAAGIFSLNYGMRLSHWSWNDETILSPRASLGFVPAANDRLTFRLATGLYYQAPFYKELRDTVTANGATTVSLNRNIQSQRSLQVVGACEYRFRIDGRPFQFTAETYYKAQSRLNPYNVDNVKIVYDASRATRCYVMSYDMVADDIRATKGVDVTVLERRQAAKLFKEHVPGVADAYIILTVANNSHTSFFFDVCRGKIYGDIHYRHL